MISRWWAVVVLSLSVGLNLGLAVAVLQQRFGPPPPPPAVVVLPSPAGIGAGATAPLPAATVEVGMVPVAPTAAPARPTPSLPPRPVAGRDDGSDAGWPAGRDGTPDERLPPPPPDLGPPGGGAFDAGGRPANGGFGGDGPTPARLEELAERLGVPAAERPRFIALQRRFVAATRERRIELEAVRRALQAELTAADPDPQRLRTLVQSSARLQAELERSLVEHVLAARKLLNGEAERRYLQFLARLGPRAGGPGPVGGRAMDPRRQRGGRPWGGDGGLRRRGFEPALPPPQAPGPMPTPPNGDGPAPRLAAG